MALTDEARQIRDQMTDLKTRGNEKAQIARSAQDEIETFKSQAGQQMVKLSRASPDTHKAWKWIQENQDKFEKHVFGPPIVECSVKDPTYADMVETLIQRDDLIGLTVQTQKDFDTLHIALFEDMKLKRVNIKVIPEASRRPSNPEVDEETMRQYGLDGWALDFLDGPEPVLIGLCNSSARLHASGVAAKDTSQTQFQRIEASPITCWVTPRHIYQIRRRQEYGPGATSTGVRQTKHAQVWTDKPVDETVREEHEQVIKDCESEILEIRRQLEAFKSELEKGKEKRDSLDNEKVSLMLPLNVFKLTGFRNN